MSLYQNSLEKKSYLFNLHRFLSVCMSVCLFVCLSVCHWIMTGRAHCRCQVAFLYHLGIGHYLWLAVRRKKWGARKKIEKARVGIITFLPRNLSLLARHCLAKELARRKICILSVNACMAVLSHMSHKYYWELWAVYSSCVFCYLLGPWS